MFYWAQIGVAELLRAALGTLAPAFGHRPRERSAMLATYVRAGHPLTHGARNRQPHEPHRNRRRALVMPAMGGRRGVLRDRDAHDSVLDSRELDILLVPFCTLAIACVVRIAQAYEQPTDWLTIFAAFLATSAAVLTKGPQRHGRWLRGHGSISLWAAWARSGTPVDAALLVRRHAAALIPDPQPRGVRFINGRRPLAALAAGVLSAQHACEPVQAARASRSSLWASARSSRSLRLLEPSGSVRCSSPCRVAPLIVIGGAGLSGSDGVCSSRGSSARTPPSNWSRRSGQHPALHCPAPLNNIEAMLRLVSAWRRWPRRSRCCRSRDIPSSRHLDAAPGVAACSCSWRSVSEQGRAALPDADVARRRDRRRHRRGLLLESAKRWKGLDRSLPARTLLMTLFALAIGQGAWFADIRNEID